MDAPISRRSMVTWTSASPFLFVARALQRHGIQGARVVPPSICKLSDIKVDAGKVTYTATCGAAAPRVLTSTYHGDSFESVDSNGAKSVGKRVGACT